MPAGSGNGSQPIQSAPADLFVELLELATSETLRYIKRLHCK